MLRYSLLADLCFIHIIFLPMHSMTCMTLYIYIYICVCVCTYICVLIYTKTLYLASKKMCLYQHNVRSWLCGRQMKIISNSHHLYLQSLVKLQHSDLHWGTNILFVYKSKITVLPALWNSMYHQLLFHGFWESLLCSTNILLYYQNIEYYLILDSNISFSVFLSSPSPKFCMYMFDSYKVFSLNHFV